jgi:hypothetical protein
MGLTIWNRWGAEVFSTKDPDINWNGQKNNDGEVLPDGVYYYRCIVDEFRRVQQQSVNEINPVRILTGFIHITRGSKGN